MGNDIYTKGFSVMKKITMFHIDECKYCDFARRAIAELREEFPEYRDVEIEMVRDGVKLAFDTALAG